MQPLEQCASFISVDSTLNSLHSFVDGTIKDESLEWPLFPTHDQLGNLSPVDTEEQETPTFDSFKQLDLSLFCPNNNNTATSPKNRLNNNVNDPSFLRSVSPTITTSDVSNSSLKLNESQSDDSSTLITNTFQQQQQQQQQQSISNSIAYSSPISPSLLSSTPVLPVPKTMPVLVQLPIQSQLQSQLQPSSSTSSTKRRGKAKSPTKRKVKARSELLPVDSKMCAISKQESILLGKLNSSSLNTSKKKSPSPVKSHTRKCREKVTHQLEILSQALPQPGNSNELKHKGQLLEYTIQTIQDLLKRKIKLQAGITLSSIASLQDYVESIINANPNDENLIYILFESFLKLYCSYTNWPYCELWNKDLKLMSTNITDDNNENLKEFSDISSSLINYFNNSNILNRVLSSCSIEWVDENGMKNDQFNRFHLTTKHGLKTLQVIPINLLHNQCIGVIVLGDTSNRQFDISSTQSLKQFISVIVEKWAHHVQ